MSNVAMDVVTGLVFVFLLYSLLATTVKEAIASFFSLRARMLKKGIVKGMLSDTPDDNRWESIGKGILNYLVEILHLFGVKRPQNQTGSNLGDLFYNHPLIKNYGSNRVFPTPSYIPTNNFSSVLIDILKQDFSDKLSQIAKFKFKQPGNSKSLDEITQSLQSSPDANKIKELFEYYQAFYQDGSDLRIMNPAIDKDTLQVLQLHLKNAFYNIQNFTKKIEDWFDESMDRVSGWYKRQAQLILFLIGLVIAIIFNADVLEITGRLSKDKDARDKLVQMAIAAPAKYKNNPLVANGDEKVNRSKDDSLINSKVSKQSQDNLDSVRTMVNGDIKNANSTLAIGWGRYGRDRDSAELLNETYYAEVKKIKSCIKNNSSEKSSTNSDSLLNSKVLDKLYEKHWVRLKICYALESSTHGRKFLGFLLFAFAVSLGSPFWFDLLNKLVKLRASGKKEDGSNGSKKIAATQQPVTVNVNSQQTGEEAVG